MHGYRFTPDDTAIALEPAWPWVAGYAIMAAVFTIAPHATVDSVEH